MKFYKEKMNRTSVCFVTGNKPSVYGHSPSEVNNPLHPWQLLLQMRQTGPILSGTSYVLHFYVLKLMGSIKAHQKGWYLADRREGRCTWAESERQWWEERRFCQVSGYTGHTVKWKQRKGIGMWKIMQLCL